MADGQADQATKPRGSGERGHKQLQETRKPGRPKGSLNKATADIKRAAQAFTDDALNTLASIMRESDSDAARVAAANSILDRGHGKAKQSLDVDANVTARVTKIERRIVDPGH